MKIGVSQQILTAQRATNSTWTLSGSKTRSLEDSANLADPDLIAAEIVEDLQAALTQFAEIANDRKR